MDLALGAFSVLSWSSDLTYNISAVPHEKKNNMSYHNIVASHHMWCRYKHSRRGSMGRWVDGSWMGRSSIGRSIDGSRVVGNEPRVGSVRSHEVYEHPRSSPFSSPG